MCKKFTPDELNQMDHTAKNDVIFQMQDRLANQQRFGRQTEKLDDIAGQLSFFNEAEANYDETAPEPVMEEVIESAKKRSRKSKKKGQREEDLKDFPQEEISHDIPEQELNEAFGSGNWKSGSNRPDGLRRNMSSKCMSERMGRIRMNSSVEIIRQLYLKAALRPLLLKPRSSTLNM